MATIRKELEVDAPAEKVWEAVRDFNAVHTRLAPGFVVGLCEEPGSRAVTFSNGTVARELLVTRDDAARRLVYAVVSERVQQHSASVQVIAEGGARTRLVWITDVLPNELAGYIDGQLELASGIMKQTLERAAGNC
jgi:hypothetical protein